MNRAQMAARVLLLCFALAFQIPAVAADVSAGSGIRVASEVAVATRRSLHAAAKEEEEELVAKEEGKGGKVTEEEEEEEEEEEAGKKHIVKAASKEGEEAAGEEAGAEEEEAEEEEEEAEEEEEEEGGEEKFTVVDIHVAVMLLGSVIFVLSLFQMVNIRDDDVRRYAWKVISNTISIFMAVLFFQGNSEMLSEAALHMGFGTRMTVFIHFCHSFLYQAAIFVMLANTFGLLCWNKEDVNLTQGKWVVADALVVTFEEEVVDGAIRNPNGNKSVYTDSYNLEVAVVKKKMEFEECRRSAQAWSTLFAHTAGFGAIGAGGSMQQSRFFRVSPLMSFIPVVVTSCLLLLTFMGTQFLHKKLMERAKASGANQENKKKCAEMVKDFAQEAENDLLSLTMSFLTVQSLRFAITGQLPNAEGIDEPEAYHLNWGHVGAILGLSAVFVGLSIPLAVVAMLIEKKHEDRNEGKGHGASHHEEEAEEEPLGERIAEIFMNCFAMASAWCVLYGARWAYMLQEYLFINSVHSIMGRVELAVVLSTLAFFAVYLLDVVDDALKGREKAADYGLKRNNPTGVWPWPKGGAVSSAPTTSLRSTAPASVPGSPDPERAGLLAPEKAEKGLKTVQRAIMSIITSISILVGFTWEHSFDGAITALASLSKSHKTSIKFFMGIVVFLFLLRPWRLYILNRSMQLDALKEERENVVAEKKH